MAMSSDLPEELVLLVLRLAVGAPARSLRMWKAAFPLLGVCRRWRVLAQQLMFCVGYVECRRPKTIGAGAREWRSSLELVAAMGNTGSVRQLVLSAVAGPQLVTQLSEMAAVLGRRPELCAGIRSLIIRGSAAASPGERPTAQAAGVVEVAAALTAAMPRVTQLRIGTGADVHATGAIGGLLVDAWAAQLRHVDCPVPVALAGCAFSGTLTHLSIALGAGPAARLPRVCAASLRVLHLDEVPAGFSWADAFSSGDAHSAAVCFASLAELRLRYRRTNMPNVCASPATAPDTDIVKLCFPQLRRCHIDGALGVAAQLPPAVDCLSLAGPPEAALALSAAGVERAGALRLCVGLPGGRSDMDAFCAATNYWFERVVVRGEAALELNQHRAPLDAQLLAWPQMTRLSIHGPCEFGTVAGIIQHAEALQRLEVYELSVYPLPTDVAVLGTGGAVRLPLRSSIETLTLYSDADEPCLPAMADTIQDLLLRLRRLTRANLSAAFGVHAADLRRGFGHQYPHVEALAIKTY